MTSHAFDFVSLNLSLYSKSEVLFPFNDYGVLYGYGVFETVLVNKRRPILLRDHIKRMEYAAGILDIPFPYSAVELEKAANLVIDKNKADHAILNIYLTPGDRKENTAGFEFQDPRLLMVVRPLPGINREKGISLAVRRESFQRVKLDQFKTMAYMKNVLEKRLTEQFDDVLLCNQSEEILETPVSNAFFVCDNEILTPKSPVILPGVVKRFLLDQQQLLGYSIREKRLVMSDLNLCDEVFLTNSIKGIILVDKMENHPHLRSGQISKHIQTAFTKLLELA